MKKVLRMALALLASVWILPALADPDPAKGQAIATQVCSACHMANGNSVVPLYPKLSAQHAEYISKQLAAYKSGERKNPIMYGIAMALSPEDMVNLGAWFESQTPAPEGAKDEALAKVGQKIWRGGKPGQGVPACASCHSPDGAGIPVLYPRLAGQHTEYVITQLNNYKSGQRNVGTAAIMVTIASKLSDQEMAALAEYMASLK